MPSYFGKGVAASRSLSATSPGAFQSADAQFGCLIPRIFTCFERYNASLDFHRGKRESEREGRKRHLSMDPPGIGHFSKLRRDFPFQDTKSLFFQALNSRAQVKKLFARMGLYSSVASSIRLNFTSGRAFSLYAIQGDNVVRARDFFLLSFSAFYFDCRVDLHRSYESLTDLKLRCVPPSSLSPVSHSASSEFHEDLQISGTARGSLASARARLRVSAGVQNA